MAVKDNKVLQRKKPGYTKAGNVRIVSLSYQQCLDLIAKTQKNKILGKIRNRMRILENRPGFVAPTKEEALVAE